MKPASLPVLLLALIAAAQGGEEAPPACWKFAPTPPMGWNSYDSFGDSVTEAEVLANARAMKDHLLPHGWTYVVVDYRWYDPGARDNNPNGRKGAALAADAFGRLLPAPNRFPSATGGQGFKPLADHLHGMGLKFGIHIMRGIPRQSVKANTPIAGSNFKAAEAADTKNTCSWCADMFGVDAGRPAGQSWYDSILRQYADWGVDFIKVDDLSMPYAGAEVEAIRRAIDRCGRAIVFSTSPGETPVSEAAHVRTHANLWRISGDFWDHWQQLDHTFDLLAAWQGHAGPGHWPDADMIPLGRIGRRSVDGYRATRFSRDEQITLMSLWAIAPSPLMLGMELTENDEWTSALLTNDEVLAVNQDPLGKQGVWVSRTRGIEVWGKELSNGAKAVALFNRGGGPQFDDSLALFKSPLVTRQTPGQAVEIDADITGARKLWLVVDDGGDDFVCDHADWIEPRLVSAQGEQRLTDLKWKSATFGWGKIAVGRSASGKELSINGKTYSDGIGTHSPSVIEYELPAGLTRFKATGGLDQGGVSQPLAGATVHFLVFTNQPSAAGAALAVPLRALGFTAPCRVRDLWQRKDLGTVTNELSASVPNHGAVLLRVTEIGAH
jgi:alpha-galactosidase